MSEKMLTKKEINQTHLYWWLAAETNNSYERLQALSFCAALARNLKKIYPDKEEYALALQRHIEFFNTEGTIGSSIVGIALAMEEERQKTGNVSGQMITNIKVGLMGPIAGIGDTLIHGMTKSIILALACTFALEGNPVAVVIPPIFAVIVFTVGRYMCRLGYFTGKDAIPKLLKSGSMNSIITAASVLGLFMMGALASNYVKVSTPLALTLSSTGTVISLQENLNKILPGILQLGVIFAIYSYLKRKRQNYVLLIVSILVLSIVAAYFGVLG